MKLLLDTHTFIWWDSQPANLSGAATAALSDPSNSLILSTASVWEMAVKVDLGKLTLRLPLAQIVSHQQTTNGLVVLPVTLPHVLELERLPRPHRDPFDRMLIAQAISEGAILVSADPVFSSYPVHVLW